MIVMVVAAVILLIASVNLASLMLSRASARSHEIAISLALGASRWRVARQMIVEGVLLSLAGAACGVLGAFWVCHGIATVIFAEYTVTIAFDPQPDARVVAATAFTAAAAGVLFSLVVGASRHAWVLDRGAAEEHENVDGVRTHGALARWRAGRALARPRRERRTPGAKPCGPARNSIGDRAKRAGVCRVSARRAARRLRPRRERQLLPAAHRAARGTARCSPRERLASEAGNRRRVQRDGRVD